MKKTNKKNFFEIWNNYNEYSVILIKLYAQIPLRIFCFPYSAVAWFHEISHFYYLIWTILFISTIVHKIMVLFKTWGPFN